MKLVVESWNRFMGLEEEFKVFSLSVIDARFGFWYCACDLWLKLNTANMKYCISIWSRLTGRSFTPVNTNPPASSEDTEDYSDNDPRTPQFKSTIVVNRFFNAALPVHADGRRKWARSEFQNHLDIVDGLRGT